MYNPQYISLPNDIYREAVNVAKSYYAMLRRQKEIEDEIINASHVQDGQPRGTTPGDATGSKAERIILRQAENGRKIKAVKQAWTTMTEPFQREFIRLNFFENIRMDDINLPISSRSMKRLRHKFLLSVAENLHEI
ncbi:MAG TPA: hypothetical protein DG942_01510 [Ruminococcaceae bacterium]|mgnify:CR=1 FL=1|jgi:hypothetical protein|nr:hypothetical protein [Oscillospiraceae bacterium]